MFGNLAKGSKIFREKWAQEGIKKQFSRAAYAGRKPFSGGAFNDWINDGTASGTRRVFTGGPKGWEEFVS